MFESLFDKVGDSFLQNTSGGCFCQAYVLHFICLKHLYSGKRKVEHCLEIGSMQENIEQRNFLFGPELYSETYDCLCNSFFFMKKTKSKVFH